MTLRILAVVALLAAGSIAYALPPPSLMQQGRLLTADGVPVNGSVAMIFSVYDVATGGSPLWAETQLVVFDDGYFSTKLGATNPVPATLWSAVGARFLGITVGADSEMSPREELVSVPYAMVAGDVVGDIHPNSISVGGKQVVDTNGNWVGGATNLQGPKGDPGPQGPQGPEGPAGPQAWNCYIQQTDLTTPWTATCKAGYYVTGGGCTVLDKMAAYAIKLSYPSAPNQWTCDANQGLRDVYAICCKVGP